MTVVQRFGSALNLNVHLHMLIPEGFTTFSGALSTQAGGAEPTGNGITDTGFFAFDASLNVDLSSGEIFAGHLYVVDEATIIDQGEAPTLREEFGFQVFFDGQVGVANGNSFADLRILDGAYRGRIPLDLDESNLDGFFSGNDGVVFLGAFGLRTDPEFGPVVSAGGLFGLSNQLAVEARLTADEVDRWLRTGAMMPRPSFGLAVFESLDSDVPGGGVLLGRSGPVIESEDFVLGANALQIPIGANSVQNTLRAGFFGQPFDFVLRRGDAMDFGFEADITPGTNPSFTGFEVAWGAWGDSSGSAGFVQNVPSDPASVVGVSNVFLANVNPTPIGALANLTGTFSYAGGGDDAIAFAGQGGGGFFAPQPLDAVAVGFDLDFTSGAISGGFLEVRYGSMVSNDITWEVGFSGFLNGAVTDLRVDRIDIALFGDPAGFSDGGGTLTGVLTGPAGQRHLGGFSLSTELDSGLEGIQGLWLIDRVGAGE